jgi:metaxin
MYLTPNFERFTVPCYISAQSSSSVVRAISTWDLRKAAESELLKHTSKISQQSLYSEAREAFQALNRYCAENISSNPKRQPTILDAALFAYTDLLWSIEYDCWADSEMIDLLMSNEAILDTYDALDEKHQSWRVPMPEQYIALERSQLVAQERVSLKTRRRPIHANQRRQLLVEAPQ